MGSRLGTAPLSTSWIISIISLYIALNRTPNKRLLLGGAQYPRSRGLAYGVQCKDWSPYLGVSQIRGTSLGVPRMRIIVFRRLYWGLLVLGNYHLFL